MMAQVWAGSLLSAIARCAYDRCGASATMVAISLPVLIGFAALGAETGLWYTIKQQNQSAADAAAVSATYQVIAGKTDVTADLLPAASEAAAQNGYTGTSPAVIYPYSDGIVSNGVAVTLLQMQGTLLASLFLPSVTIATKAVAVIKVFDNLCILALASTGIDIAVAATSSLDMPTCSVAANSINTASINILNSGSITAATLVTAGEVSLNGSPINPAAPPPEFSLTSQPMIGAPGIPDPYESTLTHAFLTAGMPTTGDCIPTTSGSVTVYNTPNCVISMLDIAPGYTVDLSPGTYWVTGNLIVQSTGMLKCSTCDNVKGTGVTIILILNTRTSKIGYVSITGGAMFNLNPPSSGQFAGVVMVQDANALPLGTTYTSSHNRITGGPGATLNGLIYFPKSSMTFQGTPSATGPQCLLLVVNTVTFKGASRLESSGCTIAGLTNFPAVNTVALAE